MGLWIYYILRSATLTLPIASVLIVVLDIPLSALLQRLVVLLNAAKRYARVQLLRRQRVPVSSCLAFHRERVLKHLPLSSLFLLSLGLTSTSVGIIDDLNRGVGSGQVRSPQSFSSAYQYMSIRQSIWTHLLPDIP